MNTEEFKAKRRAYYAANKTVFKRSAKKYEAAHRAQINAKRKAYLDARPEMRMWIAAKNRAKARDIPFTITVADIVIPEFCPALGIRLERSSKRLQPNSPSLDRRVPKLGYVPDNVSVISNRANILKNNAEPWEMQALVAWLVGDGWEQ